MMPKEEKNDVELLKTWALPTAATLGSTVRAKGILLEIRTRLPSATKKSLDIDAGELALAMPAGSKAEFHAASAVVAEALENIQTLPVIPREIQTYFRSRRPSVIAGSRTAACQVQGRAQ